MLGRMPKQLDVARGSRPRSTRLLAVVLAAALSITLAACGGRQGEREEARLPAHRGWRQARRSVAADGPARRGEYAEPPGPGHQDRQHGQQPAPARPEEGRPDHRGAGRGRHDPAGRVLLPAAARRGRPGALDARLRHRHRQAGPRRDRGEWCRPADDRPTQGSERPLLHRGRAGLLPRGQPPCAVQPDGAPATDGEGREEEGRRARELPAVGPGVRLHRQPAGNSHRRDLQPRARPRRGSTRAASTRT